MKVIIVGAGKIGVEICSQLANEQYEVTVIDTDAEVLQTLTNTMDVFAVVGSGISVSALKRANVSSCDLLIAVTASDALNVLCCGIAKRLGAKNTIARVRGPEYNELLSVMKNEWALSMTLNPERSVAREIARIVRFPSVAKIETFVKGRVDIAEFKISSSNPLCGVSLFELRRLYKYKVLICTVRRGKEVIIPTGNFTLQADDIISVTGADRDIELFLRAIGAYKKRIKNMVVVGGGAIAYYLIEALKDSGMNITVIEKDHDRALWLSEQFEAITVICGDGADQEMLIGEGLETADAFVALTGIDEENAIISMYAMQLGVEKVITKIDRQNFADLASGVGLESVVSPKGITASNVLRYARGMHNSGDSEIETLHKIANNSTEAMEFIIREESEVTNIELKDLKLKNGTLIACIIHGNQIIIPTGTDTIQVGDTVIVVTTNAHINNIKDILRV